MDIRVFEIDVTVTTPPLQTSLEFRAPVRQKIMQSIPIVNNGKTNVKRRVRVGQA